MCLSVRSHPSRRSLPRRFDGASRLPPFPECRKRCDNPLRALRCECIVEIEGDAAYGKHPCLAERMPEFLRKAKNPSRAEGMDIQRFRAPVRNDRNEHVSRLGGRHGGIDEEYHLRIGQIRRNLGKKLVIQVKRHRFSPPFQPGRDLWRQDMPHSIVLAKGISVTYDMHAHHKTPRFATTLRTFFGKEQARSSATHTPRERLPPERSEGTERPLRFRTDHGQNAVFFSDPWDQDRSWSESRTPLASNTWSRRGIFPTAWVEQERHGS
jgi:hypothetical protein